MKDKLFILDLIKDSVEATAPGAEVILYGSFARGDFREDSDIDILILVDMDKDKISIEEEMKIDYPLFDIGFKTGTIISPMIYTKKAWASHMVTPFYENVNSEGRVL